MKKITLFITLMISSLGIAQVPTSSPAAPPVRNATDVISIYGGDDNGYVNIAPVNYVPNWNQGGWVAPNPAFVLEGKKVMKYTNFTYQGIEFTGTPKNISGMNFLHIDIWTNNQAVNIFVISDGPEISKPLNTVAGSWQSIDIPITGITGNLANIKQFKFDGGTGGEIYIDNLYFWKSPPNPVKDASLSDLKVDGATITSFSASALSYTIELLVGSAVIPQITGASTTNSSATRVITQATAIPGSATVAVTSSDGTTKSTYTVNFKASKPNSSPTPTTPKSTVLSIYGDTGGYTNIWTKDYAFGSFVNKQDLDPTAGTNEAIKMDFSIAGYGEGKGAAVDISSYNFVHFDYFVDASLPAGSNGDQVRFILIATGGAEYNYEMTLAGSDGILVKGSWQTVKVPLSVFTAKGFNKANFLQFKLGTASDLNSKVVYFDNIYFSTGATLGTEQFKTSGVKMYPNPVKNTLTIKANSAIQKVTVYNILGQETLKVSPNSNTATLQTDELHKGVYIVATEIEGKVTTSKIVKE